MELFRNQGGILTFNVDPRATQAEVRVVGNGMTITNTLPVSAGVVTVPIDYAMTLYDADLIIDVDYTTSTDIGQTFYASVVTPLVSFQEDDQYKNLERLVRLRIVTFTGQTFGLSKKKILVRGKGNDYIDLPERLISISEPAGQHNILGDGRVLKYDPTYSGTYNSYFSLGVIHAPDALRRFNSNMVYEIDGLWGYLTPPEPVLLAAEILYNHFSCYDASYIDKYLLDVRNSAGSLRYSIRAHNGTGSVAADQLLTPYVANNMMII